MNVEKGNNDDEQPKETEEERVLQNEDILTDTGRDKSFKKEDTGVDDEEGEPVVTLETKD